MKRSEIGRRPLSDRVLGNLEPEAGEYRERDSGMLYFRVKPSGNKSWQYRYKKQNNKWSWMGLGTYPEVSGKLARSEATKLADRSSKGEDLSQERIKEYTLSEVIEEFLAYKESQNVSVSRMKALRNFGKHLGKHLGDCLVRDIKPIECVKAIRKIEAQGITSVSVESAMTLKVLFSFAIASGYAELNPASEVGTVIKKHKSQTYPFLREALIGKFLYDIETQLDDTWGSQIRLMVLTTSRPSMVTYMKWTEVDLDKGIWTVPKDKMKTRREHDIPLVKKSIEELRILKSRDVPEWQKGNDYVFKATVKRWNKKTKQVAQTRGKTIISFLLKTNGYGGLMVPHGFRHMASTLLREHRHQHGFQIDVIERQLAHIEGGMSGTYNKAEYLEQRRELMEWYCHYIYTLRDEYVKTIR